MKEKRTPRRGQALNTGGKMSADSEQTCGIVWNIKYSLAMQTSL